MEHHIRQIRNDRVAVPLSRQGQVDSTSTLDTKFEDLQAQINQLKTSHSSYYRPSPLMVLITTGVDHPSKEDREVSQDMEVATNKEQFTYTEKRLRDLENVKEVKNINPILRVFTGDNPARQFESGQQRGGKFSCRRQCTLQCEGRTALLILWGQKSEDDIIPGLYEVYAVRPTNDFNGQRSYNSTPSTAFKTVEEDAPVPFEGEITSVCFERYMYIKLLSLPPTPMTKA
uniref:Uncharacterized protein n=1 Tax=Magallana gigas TaxID=29159 RepID=A0A8W8MMZ3_MAGGI